MFGFFKKFEKYPNATKYIPAVLIVLYDAYDPENFGPEHHSIYFDGEHGCTMAYDPAQPSDEILANNPHLIIGKNDITWPGTLISFGKMYNGDLLAGDWNFSF